MVTFLLLQASIVPGLRSYVEQSMERHRDKQETVEIVIGGQQSSATSWDAPARARGGEIFADGAVGMRCAWHLQFRKYAREMRCCAFPLLFYCNVVGVFGFGWRWFSWFPVLRGDRLDEGDAQHEYEFGVTGNFTYYFSYPFDHTRWPMCRQEVRLPEKYPRTFIKQSSRVNTVLWYIQR